MNEYIVKVGFWLRAFDSTTIIAEDDATALVMAKDAARTVMESHAMPEAIDLDERREGSISHIDRCAPGDRQEVAGYAAFDDGWLHAPWRDFIEHVATLPELSPQDAGAPLAALIAQAKALLRHVA